MNLFEGDTELKINSNIERNMAGEGVGERLTLMSYRHDLLAFRG